MFDAYRDIGIAAFAGDVQVGELNDPAQRVTLRTVGLAQHGHPEFELVDVPAELNGEATMLLNAAADSAMQRKPFADGRIWASRLDAGFLVVARPSDIAGRFRLVDLDAPDSRPPAKMAVTAMAVERARLVREEDPDMAMSILDRALRWFPGEPGEGMPLQNGELCNQGNSLAYFSRAEWENEKGAKDSLFQAAFSRSRALLEAELGGPVPPPVPFESLRIEIARIVETLQANAAPPGAADLPPVPMGMMFLLSPALRLNKEGTLSQSLAIGLPQVRGYFFEGPVASWLRDPQVQAHAAMLYEVAHRLPAFALVLSMDTVHDHYEGGYRFADTLPSRPFTFASTLGDLSHVPMLTRVLATMGRELAAGISGLESRARWGIDNAPALASAAAGKLAALGAKEDEAIRTVYGLG